MHTTTPRDRPNGLAATTPGRVEGAVIRYLAIRRADALYGLGGLGEAVASIGDATRAAVLECKPRVRTKASSGGGNPHGLLDAVGVIGRRLGVRDLEVLAFDDVTPYLRQASVVLCPLRVGGGVKVKVLEALRERKALVTTSVGAQGIGQLDGGTLIADHPTHFADAVIRLFEDFRLRGSLERRPAQVAACLPTWDDATAALLSSYHDLWRHHFRSGEC